ncbi:EAL domain-containing protein [Uliginosibacterium sediminicola]|uniref:EAL domain-containing protein n=1 Tax=Uliginosibacterium sediminicola TaxID=2024550 RepID=A0ABU9Z0N8_9RHOO
MLAILVGLLAIFAWSSRPHLPLLERLDHLLFDAQTQWRGRLQAAAQPGIVLVKIDDRSLQRLGGFSPDRRTLARAIDLLNTAQARLIALDLLLLEPGRADPAADAVLSSAMRASGKLLIPFALLDEAGQPPTSPGKAVLDNAFLRTRGESASALLPMRPQQLLAPPAGFAEAAQALGHVSALRAPDGAPRFDLPGLPFAGEIYPSLAVRIAAIALDQPWSQVELDFGNALKLGSLTVPLDAQSRQWINYYGPSGSFESISFIDLLDGHVDPARLRGRIVLLGSTAIGAGDVFPSPFDTSLPGVERMATVVDNILSGRVLQRPHWASAAELLAMLVLPMLACWLISRWPLRYALSALAILALGLVTGLQALFVHAQLFLAPAFPVLALLLGCLSALVLRGAAEQARRRAALLALQASEERYALALRGANDGMWDWDLLAEQVFFSDRWYTLMGQDKTQPARMSAWTAALDEAGRQAFEHELAEHLAGRSLQLHHVLSFRQGGVDRWLLVRGIATRDANGRALRMAGSLTDISESQRLQQQITHDALHDRLTGLLNRAAFLQRLEQACAIEAGKSDSVAVLIIDIDDFRTLNEREGIAAGDAILIELAQRLAALQGPSSALARLAADRFVLSQHIADVGDESAIGDLLGRVQSCLQAPFQLAAGALTLSASIGWAHLAQDLHSATELLAAAEMALAHAKTRLRGQTHAYDPAELQVENKRRWLKENLDLAIASQQFVLHYQPLVLLADRRLVGFEALIRWPHPDKGMVMPGDFIPYAEESGQILAMGQWILREAARQLVAWDALGFRGEIAVNLSGRQFSEGDLLADARAVLDILGSIDPRRLKLEVTESMAMSNPQVTANALQALSALGFKISIDDFGTGYSSLAYLHRFPFDTLKIDRSFVIRLAAGREAVEIVRTIVGLAKALGKQTLAEGVEEVAQAQLLHELGVEIGQGWLFAKALAADQAEAFLLQNQPA